MSTDDQNINNPNNPCYDDKQRKLFISKPKFPKQAMSTTNRDKDAGNKPLPHFEKEEIAFEDGSKGSVSWIPMPGVDYKGKLPIEKSIKEALNDTKEPTYKESNLTIKVLEDFLSSKNEEEKEAPKTGDKES